MNMTNVIEARDGGITYLTRGELKEDLLALASAVDSMTGDGGANLTDEQLKALVTSTIEKYDAQFEVLYTGMNYIGEELMKAGIIPRPK